MQTPNVLEFLRGQRTALMVEIDAIDDFVAAMMAEAPGEEPGPVDQQDPAPSEEQEQPGEPEAPEAPSEPEQPETPETPEPQPQPTPDPAPPAPPVIGNTVALNETDLRDKVAALGANAGDYVIGVKDGHFGALTLANVNIGGRLTIVAENRRQAKFERINLNGNCRKISLVGLGTCPKGDFSAGGLGKTKQYGITTATATSEIIVEDAFCQGHVESADHAQWTLQQWRARALGGVFLQGPDSIVRNSYAEGVRFGFNLTGDRGMASHCRVFGASGDAFRACAQDLVMEHLMGSDLVFMQDGNHPDILQSFIVRNGANVIVQNLRLLNIAGFDWTVRSDNLLRFRSEAKPQMQGWGRAQGIGFHSTFFANLHLEDIYIRTPIANGINIGGTNGLYGRRWDVLSSDYGLPTMAPATQPSYDTRLPKIRVNASGAVDVADTIAEDYAGNLATQIANRKDATVSEYASPRPEPAWIAPLRALAA